MIKFSCGYDDDYVRKHWLPCFAWFPVCVGTDERGKNICVWLGRVERQLISWNGFTGAAYRYRLPESRDSE